MLTQATPSVKREEDGVFVTCVDIAFALFGLHIIPAKAGIQTLEIPAPAVLEPIRHLLPVGRTGVWIPAFAGMTGASGMTDASNRSYSDKQSIDPGGRNESPSLWERVRVRASPGLDSLVWVRGLVAVLGQLYQHATGGRRMQESNIAPHETSAGDLIYQADAQII